MGLASSYAVRKVKLAEGWLIMPVPPVCQCLQWNWLCKCLQWRPWQPDPGVTTTSLLVVSDYYQWDKERPLAGAPDRRLSLEVARSRTGAYPGPAWPDSEALRQPRRRTGSLRLPRDRVRIHCSASVRNLRDGGACQILRASGDSGSESIWNLGSLLRL